MVGLSLTVQTASEKQHCGGQLTMDTRRWPGVWSRAAEWALIWCITVTRCLLQNVRDTGRSLNYFKRCAHPPLQVSTAQRAPHAKDYWAPALNWGPLKVNFSTYETWIIQSILALYVSPHVFWIQQLVQRLLKLLNARNVPSDNWIDLHFGKISLYTLTV